MLKKTYGKGYFDEETVVINAKSKANEKVIEMVGFEKVALQQSDLFSLKEVDLSETMVSHGVKEHTIASLCPRLKYLSLSKTLLSTFKDALQIIQDLENLQVWNISENKIYDWNIEEKDIFGKLPNKLCSLYMNDVNINWEQLLNILQRLPTIKEVYACFNPIATPLSQHDRIKELEILNLEGCHINSWENLKKVFSGQSKLEWLILNDNQLEMITCEKDADIFSNLKSLSLNFNKIEKWDSINELRNLKNLNEVRFRDNPVSKDLTTFELRMELVARLDNVDIINGSKVEPGERRVAEVTYIKKYSSDFFSSQTTEENKLAFHEKHPCYSKMIEVHGAPVQEKTANQKLKENLLSITIKCPDCDSKAPFTKKVPANMKIQQLKGIIQRAMKVPNIKQKLSYLDQKNSREIELDDNMKELSYYSMKTDDVVFVRW
ncbi:tubulin-specific chaperone E-like [Clytia hemisphaerica]